MALELNIGTMSRWSTTLAAGWVLLVMGAGCDAQSGLSADEMYARALAFDAKGIEKEAGFWYQRAANAGHPLAQVDVGFMYRYGFAGFLRDPYERARWFLQASWRTQPMVLADFGFRYEYGRSGVLRDAKTAEAWFRRAAGTCEAAAIAGDLKAQVLLGGLYGAGTGVPKNRARAVELWRDAAERGSVEAQVALGRLFRDEYAFDEARYWLAQAADHAEPEAEYLLSTLYQFGQGVPADHDTALDLLRRSADHGYASAQRQLRSMATLGLAG